MERVNFSVGKNALLPAGREAEALMSKLKIGETVACELFRARNNTFAARIHFVFERIAAAQGMKIRNVKGWVAAATGRADVVTISGITAIVPHPTGAQEMGTPELEAFWSDARQVIIDEICPTLDQRDATDVLQMIADMERIDGES